MHKRGIAAVPLLLSKWCFVLGAAGRLAGGADADRRARGRRRVRQEEQEPAARRAGNVNVLFFYHLYCVPSGRAKVYLV